MRKVDPAKHEEKRLEILAAAETCFVRKGFRGASIADICVAAGISPGHLYHYFTDKESIVAAIAELRLKAASEDMGRILDAPDPFATFLQQICRRKPGGQSDSALLLELLAESSRNPAIGATMREQSVRIRDLFGAILREGQSDGKVDRALDPDLAASVLIAVVIDGMKALAVREPNVNRNKIGRIVEILVTRFLAAPSS
jgi:TetR/AcrR family transcriptional regulator, repressor for uid operon